MSDSQHNEVVVKAAATLAPGEDDATTQHGTFDVILSTPALDRDGEEVKAEEWKQPLPDRITFDIDHGMSVEKTIGSGRPFLNDDGNLQVKGSYASTPLAQLTRTLVNEGHIFATSVTFLRRSSTEEKSGKAKTVRELLNGAFVSVPANPQALVLSSKAGARNSSKDSDRLQSIHDLAVANGAVCTTDTSAPDPGKAAGPPEMKAAAPAPAMSPAEVDALLAVARATADCSTLL